MLTAVPDYIYHIVNCDPSQQLAVMANDGCRNPIMLFEQLRNLSGLMSTGIASTSECMTSLTEVFGSDTKISRKGEFQKFIFPIDH